MIGLLISWGIVAMTFAACVDWRKALIGLIDQFETMFHVLANGTEKLVFVIVVLPANYLNGYSYKGKHHRSNARQPTDSEVDRWRGADDRFADFLHTLNTEIHLNDQARA
jgi:hypothetical protein